MRSEIAETAGKVWKILGRKGEVNISKLSRILKQRNNVVYQALGRLAREDKINYRTTENNTFVSLIESEYEIFRNSFQPDWNNTIELCIKLR